MHITQIRLPILIILTSYLLSACSFSPAINEHALPLTASKQAITKRLEQHYQSWKHVPYQYGGTNKAGIDCSSFTQNTYKAVFGLNIPRSTRQQAHIGKTISKNNHRPGDLVFFKTSRPYRHVGIYIGSNRFLHVSKSKGVIISQLNQRYWQQHYWKTVRVM